MDEAEGGLRVGALPTDVCGLLAAARAAHLLGPGECRAEPIVLHRRAGLVVRVGGLVLKAHPEGTRRAQLRARLRAANTTGSFLTPLHTEPARLGGRLVSVWPYGLPVDPERPADAPFLDAAALLAQLHAQTPVVPGLPRHRAVQRVAGALTRARVLGAQALSAARRAVEGAAGTLPAWARDPDVAVPPGRPRRLVHGDWHLGQMVRPLGLTRPGGGGAEAGRYAAGQHEAGQHAAGQHEAGQHAAGQHEAGQHEPG